MPIIKTKKELKFYILADRIMNGKPLKASIREWLYVRIMKKERILDYLKYMRKLNYYEHQTGLWNHMMEIYYMRKYNSIELQLRIHIEQNVFGYGLVLPHADSYRIGVGNSVGNYAVVQGHAYITASSCHAGDCLYLAVGSVVIGSVVLGDNVTVSANTLVNKSYGSNLLLVGSPASVKKENYPAWYEKSETYCKRIERVEELRKEMFEAE